MAQVDSVQFAWCRPTGVVMSCVVGCCWTIMMVRYDSSIIHSHSFKIEFCSHIVYVVYVLLDRLPCGGMGISPWFALIEGFQLWDLQVKWCLCATLRRWSIYCWCFFCCCRPYCDWIEKFSSFDQQMLWDFWFAQEISGVEPEKVWQWSTVVNTIWAKRIPGTWSWTLWFQGHFWILAPIHSNQLHVFSFARLLGPQDLKLRYGASWALVTGHLDLWAFNGITWIDWIDFAKGIGMDYSFVRTWGGSSGIGKARFENNQRWMARSRIKRSFVVYVMYWWWIWFWYDMIPVVQQKLNNCWSPFHRTHGLLFAAPWWQGAC